MKRLRIAALVFAAFAVAFVVRGQDASSFGPATAPAPRSPAASISADAALVEPASPLEPLSTDAAVSVTLPARVSVEVEKAMNEARATVADVVSGVREGVSEATSALNESLPQVQLLAQAAASSLPSTVSNPHANYEIRIRDVFANDEAPLLVFYEPGSEAKVQDVNEDIRIMSRVLSNALRKEFPDGFARPGIFGLTGKPFEGSGVRALYIQHIGPFFMLDVRFPLVPPPEQPQTSEEPGSERDVLWEQAKQEITEPNTGKREVIRVFKDETESTVAFDERTIERFIETLIEALKHASNMRIGDDENVTIVVRGPRGGGIGQSDALPREGQNAVTLVPTPFGAYPTERTTLVIRAGQRDVKRYANGELNHNTFTDAIRINSY
jgi:hypothetical protein